MKTKLTTLNPRWTLGTHWATPDGVGHSFNGSDAQGRFGMGISFDCPLHMALNSPLQNRHRIKIFFANPMDGRPPEFGVPLWQRNGGTFKALTACPAGDAHPKCWNGFIKNGEIG
jgi:hypothetical protein